MLPLLAELGAFSERLGVSFDGDSSDYARAQAALEDASALIRAEAGTDWVDENGDLSEDIPAVVVSIALAVAYRAFKNPDGTTQTSVGDVSVTFTREGVAGAVFLTKAERRAIHKAAGSPRFGSIGLVTPYGGGYGGTDANGNIAYFVDVEGGGDKLPIGPFPWEVW